MPDQQSLLPDAPRVAVLAESRAGERRVALTPDAVRELRSLALAVSVARGAGLACGFSDADYRQAGADVVDDRQRLYDRVRIVVWVKPPRDLAGEVAAMPGGATIVGFTDPYRDLGLERLAAGNMIEVLSLELLPGRDDIDPGLGPELDAFAVMSRFAGRIAIREAIELRLRQGYRKSGNVLVIGAGQAGLAGARFAAGLAERLVIASTGNGRGSAVAQALGAEYVQLADERSSGDRQAAFRSQQLRLRDVIDRLQPAVVLTTARRHGERAPLLLPRESIARLAAGSVVMDLTASAGGNTALIRFGERVCTDGGVWICNRSNYPNAEPREASIAYAGCVAQVIRWLARRDDRRARGLPAQRPAPRRAEPACY